MVGACSVPADTRIPGGRVSKRPKRKQDRQVLARIREQRCFVHNLPVTPASGFDGGTCSLGCVVLNTVRWALDRKIRERAQW